MNKVFHGVFKPGKYPQGDFPASFCKSVASVYDPKLLEAPVTTDHAEVGPSKGWIEAVKFEGDQLEVSFRDIDVAFAAEVNAGKWRYPSVEFFTHLPEVNGPYLKAVTFLGAQTPAVLGQEVIKFSHEGKEVVRFQTELRLAEPQEAAGTESGSVVADVPPQTPATQSALATVDFARVTDAEVLRAEVARLAGINKDLTAQFAVSDAERKAASERLSANHAEMQRQRFEVFINEQIAWGNVNDEMKTKLLALLEGLAAVPKFARAETSPADMLMDFVKSIPKFAPTGEIAKKNLNNPPKGADVSLFANADPERISLHMRVTELAEKEKITYEHALAKLTKG